MKREDFASFIVYLLMIAMALIIGFTLVKGMFNTYNNSSCKEFNTYLFAVIIIVGSIIVNAVGIELFHALGAKIGGYFIVSINILGFCFTKKGKKIHFSFKNFDGLTGETTLAPKVDKPSPKMFVWLPLIAYVVELIICIIFYTLGSNKVNADNPTLIFLGTAAIILITISSMMALYNFVPIKLDSMTDGYRLTLISKKVNVDAYNELMRVENLQREGKSIDKVAVFDDVTDFTASLNLITVYEHLSRNEYDDALKLIDKMCEHKENISHYTYYRLVAQKLYIKIITLPLEEAREYYDKEVDDSIRRFISNDLSMESIRAYILIAGMLDESSGEVEFASSRKNKAMKNSLKSRAIVEEKLYKEALKMVKEAHKDWDLTCFK